MKEELCEKVVEVRRKSDRVMTVVMALEEEVVRIICVYGPQSGRTGAEKERFYDDLRREWDLHNMGELVLGMGDLNGHVGKWTEHLCPGLTLIRCTPNFDIQHKVSL